MSPKTEQKGAVQVEDATKLNNIAAQNAIVQLQSQGAIKPPTIPPRTPLPEKAKIDANYKVQEDKVKKAAVDYYQKPDDRIKQRTLEDALKPIITTALTTTAAIGIFLSEKVKVNVQGARDAEFKGDQTTLATNMDSAKQASDAKADLEGKDKNRAQADVIAAVAQGMTLQQQQDILRAASSVGYSDNSISIASRELAMLGGRGTGLTERTTADLALETFTLELLRNRMMELTRQMHDQLDKQRNDEWSKRYAQLYEKLEMYRGASLRGADGAITEDPAKLMQYALVQHTELSARLHMGMLGDVTASRVRLA
ncbi:MAG: hypothetical protein PHF60_03865 [Candidatus ainarchaeum sp.]|nr:hypothetical protein [Candidatus ainarchaeum sp.]